MPPKHLASCIGATLALAMPLSAQAIITINMLEVGAHVVATGSGTANTAALIYDTVSSGPKVWPVFVPQSLLTIGLSAGKNDAWGGAISGPANFGTSASSIDADEATGDRIGLVAQQRVYLPLNYVSGTPVSGSSTWLNNSLASLGVTAGSYTWTWGAGANADALVLNIGAPVPEPAAVAMMLAGLLAVAVRLQRRSHGAPR